jgi:tetratricopeptide (TPR) repeat protein
MGSGDYDTGFRTAAQAAEIGERFGDADLVWLARDEQARALAQQGRLRDAPALVDEALVAAVDDELSPIVTGIVYCKTIAFAGRLRLRHAREWTETLTRWCERQPEMVAHNGLCLVHCAEIMELQGAWDEALDEARQAAEHFTRGVLNELACGAALDRQGEIHRLRGEYAAAEEAYKRASGADTSHSRALRSCAWRTAKRGLLPAAGVARGYASGATLGARGQRCEHLREVAADLRADLRAHGLGGRPGDLHPIGDARAFVADGLDPVRRADDEVTTVGLVDEQLGLDGFGDA